jgi:hypothetical protein
MLAMSKDGGDRHTDTVVYDDTYPERTRVSTSGKGQLRVYVFREP